MEDLELYAELRRTLDHHTEQLNNGWHPVDMAEDLTWRLERLATVLCGATPEPITGTAFRPMSPEPWS
jgi:hypothetical protein